MTGTGGQRIVLIMEKDEMKLEDGGCAASNRFLLLHELQRPSD